jgi:hypothetical protein
MEGQLYLRMRGRVLGPFDEEKLRGLARRGQLSRMHELSPDATNWGRASTYPELFVMEEKAGGASPQPGVDADAAAAVDGQQLAVAAPARRWWYRKDGAETGPVDQAVVQQAIASGLLNGEDFVWADGMSEWAPARHAPGLAVPSPNAPWLQGGAGALPAATAAGKDELPSDLCKAAVSARPWLIFVAVVAFACTGLAVALGIFLLIRGAAGHAAGIVAGGLFWLIYGLDLAAGGFLLMSCANRVGGLRFSRRPTVLEKTLEMIRTFWIYVSINLIVFLAFLATILIWLIACGFTLPGF